MLIPSICPWRRLILLSCQEELAATSYYEAALYEDPAIDVEDYFSDWDYYSDDYYDDNPSAKRSGAGAKHTSAATKSRRAHPASREDNRLARPQSSVQPDIASFQGVIWKTAGMEKDQDVAIQIYEPGHGDKVALLENWREVFKSAQPALDKSRLRKRKPSVMELEDASFADDEFPRNIDEREEEKQHDSSDRMSDITENGDAGNASNTTPELVQSPKAAPQPMVVVPIKRGLKRKAEVPPDEVNKENPGGGSAKTKSKRGRPKKSDGKASITSASSGPVRRSTRQKK